MGTDRTSRWKHTDTHADLRAFLGDAASLFTRTAALPQRERQLNLLADQYGLSRGLAERAISALVLSHGESHTAYELLAQWSVANTDGELEAKLAHVAQRPTSHDDQDTAEGEIELELPTFVEVKVVQTSPANLAFVDTKFADTELADTELADTNAAVSDPVARLSRRFVEYVHQQVAKADPGQLDDETLHRELIAAAVRQFGLKPQSARGTLAEVLPRLIGCNTQTASDQAAAGSPKKPSTNASPDTLPDLESILREEAHWLLKGRENEASSDAGSEVQSQRDAFRQYIDQRLTSTGGNQLDARQWKALRDHGTVQFGLSSTDVIHLIEERAHHRRIQVWTPARASEQFYQQVVALYRRRGRMSPAMKRRLLTLAKSLGLEADQAGRIVERATAIELPRAEFARSGINHRLLITISGTAACAMFAFFAWVAVSQRPVEQVIASHETRHDREAAHVAPARPLVVPSWFDRQMVAIAEHVSPDDRELRTMLRELDQSVAQGRQASLLSFYENLDYSSPKFLQADDEYRRLLVGYLVNEPEQSAAVGTYRAIGNSIKTLSTQWPATEGTHTAMFWQLDCLLSAVESPQINSERATAFAGILGDVLNLSFTAADDLVAWRSACTLALAERCCHMLTRANDRPTESIVSACRSFALASKSYLAPAQADRVGSRLLCTLLQAGHQSSSLHELTQSYLDSPDTLNVLRFVAAYEQMPASTARRELGQLLVARAGLRHEERTAEQIARVVRAALAYDNPADHFVDRWEQFTFAAEQLVSPAEFPVADRLLAQRILEVAHQNLLGTALDLHEGQGRAVFDQYSIEGAPQLADSTQPAKQPRFSPTTSNGTSNLMPPHVAKELLRRSHLLTKPNNKREYQEHWEIVVRIVERWEELPPPVAYQLGQFVLSLENAPLEEQVLVESKQLLAMPEFQLALAEAIVSSPLDDAKLATRLSTLLGQQVALSGPGERAKLRVGLLQSLHSELTPSTNNTGVESGVTSELRSQLTRLYQAKARLCGVSPGAYLTADNPADMLAALIEHQAVADSQRWAAAELAAARLRARSELELLVLLQRLRLKLLAERLTEVQPQQAEAIAHLLEQQPSLPPSAQTLLSQLASGEATELKLWLLHTAIK